MKKLILASGSERRNHLLKWLGVPFEVVESGFDESFIKEKDPERLVKKLALRKAEEVVSSNLKKTLNSRFIIHNSIFIIGADTVVRVDNEVIGKPKDEKDAVRILTKLSSKTHEVFTGVAVISMKKDSSSNTIVGAERTEVTFRKLSQKEIKDYVATGEPLDKGGAYAIQKGAKGFVKDVKGSYTNVVGLPLLLLCKLLEKQGYKVGKDVADIILNKTGHWS